MKTSEDHQPKRMPARGVSDWGSIAHRHTTEFNPKLLKNPGVFDPDAFISEYLQLPMLKLPMFLSYIDGFITLEEMLFPIGEADIPIESGSIIISDLVQNDTVDERYIKTHEAAHWIRDTGYSAGKHFSHYCCKNFSVRINWMDTAQLTQYLSNSFDAEHEIAANGVANHLLMPSSTFVPLVMELMLQHGIRDLKFIVGEHDSEAEKIIDVLATIYRVPKYAVRNHLCIHDFYVDLGKI